MSTIVSMPCSETVLCLRDEMVVIDVESIRDACSPILKRFLGIYDNPDDTKLCFKECTRDDQGRLTFAKQLGISRSSFQAMITFLKTGYVSSVEVLVRTMDILGGSDILDAYVAKYQVAKEASEQYLLEKEMAMRTNPMSPKEDIDNLFIWSANAHTWSLSNRSVGWSVTEETSVGGIFYWRRRISEDMSDE